MTALPPRQGQVYALICEYTAKHHRGPTYVVIASTLGVSTTMARAHVLALQRKGLVQHGYGDRGVTPAPEAHVRELDT